MVTATKSNNSMAKKQKSANGKAAAPSVLDRSSDL
jgi:hypothetical protein